MSFAFFMLGLGFTALGKLLSGNRALVARLGGILIILLGLYQVGFLQVDALQKERRLPFDLNRFSMNPLTALILGFTFSFAWTPCVGPALTSVLVMAGSPPLFGGYKTCHDAEQVIKIAVYDPRIGSGQHPGFGVLRPRCRLPRQMV